jgi:hypothetical protein
MRARENKIHYSQGERIGLCIFIKDIPRPEQETGTKRWATFECQFCKKEFDARIDTVKRFLQKSCGCQKGCHIHDMYGTRVYRIWHDMITRCTYPKHHSYPRYGGSGISVCEEWRNFKCFMEWALVNGYKDDLSIDRIDRTKGYSIDNCRWSTRSEQELNKKKTGNEGISFIYKKWRASVKRNGVSKHIGMFNSKEDAINARKQYIEINYGKSATL